MTCWPRSASASRAEAEGVRGEGLPGARQGQPSARPHPVQQQQSRANKQRGGGRNVNHVAPGLRPSRPDRPALDAAVA